MTDAVTLISFISASLEVMEQDLWWIAWYWIIYSWTWKSCRIYVM